MTATGTRYSCPLPDCDWHHDVPDAGLDDLDLVGDPAAKGYVNWAASVVEQSMKQRAAVVDAVAIRHLEGHSLLECVAALVAEQGRAKAAEAEAQRQLDAKIGVAGRWGNDLADKVAAESALARVRALHRPVTIDGMVCCDECSTQRRTGPRTWDRAVYIPYPCRTVQALDGETS